MLDFLGEHLAVGDYVSGISSENETPHMYQVTGNTPKKLRLMHLDGTKAPLKFPYDVLKLNPFVVEALIKQPPRDALGEFLEVGDTVFGSGGAYIDPLMFKIESFLPRSAMVTKVYGKHYCRGPEERYLTDLIKVHAGKVTMHCLKKGYK